MKSVLIGGLALAFASALAAQAPPRPASEIARLGPQVGQRAPDFSLPDQEGRVRTLRSVLGRGGAMLVFFRSADW